MSEDAVPISVLKHSTPIKLMQEYLERELVKCASQMNVGGNLQSHQVPFIAETILETYKGESLEDITLCLRRGTIGFYGTVYNRFDMAVIGEWMGKYLEEKCSYLERGVTKEKTEFQDVDYKAFQVRLEKERRQEAEQKQKEFDERKSLAEDYLKRLNPEEQVMKQMREKWLLETHDIYFNTARPKPGSLSFSEWLKTQTI